FYKIDPNLFAPAIIIVNNVKTGKTFKAGKINPQILANSSAF
ncbi:methenyltetrahydromethanopterin cyclohydrolase, partial [Candidatus Bathyarchaeota archaeon]